MIGSLIQDRYRIESELGRGGMGVVYRAEDTLLERPVAIKMVSAAGLGSEGRSRLLQEARAAARLNHPNIVSVYDVGPAEIPGQVEPVEIPGLSGPVSYIVMEFVEGKTLRESDIVDLDQVVEITKNICSALEIAHGQGIIHRDLKPENVILTDSGAIKLMDFGLARISDKTHLTQAGTFMGTSSYLGPEIIMGQEASPASDLYALGVVAYEMSAKRPPFEGDNLTAIISQHLHAPVVPPSAYNERIPPGLDRLIVRLLNKRPEDRPASAEEVRLALERLSLTADTVQSAPDASQLSRLVRGRMIGREDEFAEAVGQWQEAGQGHGRFLLISGEPGIGKTRMVRELSAYAEISGGKTLIGYCYAEEHTPYGAIAQMVELSLKNGSRPDLPEPVLADLLNLAPELRLVYPDVRPNERLDPEAEQQQIIESIITWFGALTQDGQVLLAVDDIHWADSGSLTLLRHLARRIDRRRALIVATYREIELDETLPFQEMLNELNRDRLATRIKLARLDKEQTHDLLKTLFAEEISPEFLDGIYRETEGNPFFVEEVCKALIDSGKLYFEDGRWQRPEMDALDIPQSIKVTIQSRLSKLSKAEQGTLRLAALLGRDFEYEMLLAASDLDEDTLIDALERAEQAQLVEEIRRPGLGRGTLFSFTHALIHSTLLSNLSTLRRQRLQHRVALALEETFPDRKQELAPLLGRYFAEADDGDKAILYLLSAGDDARQLYAYDEAIDAYEGALIFLREYEDHQRAARTLMKLGLTYHNALAFEESRRAYEEAFTERQRADLEYATVQKLPDAPHGLRWPFDRLPITVDPSLAGDTYSMFYIDLLFSGLVELGENDELVPDVALSWDVLDGGTRYIFHLRDGVKWSDGMPVTAKDFEYAIRRALAPENDITMVKALYDIKGAQAYHNQEEDDLESIGVRATGDKTLVITLERPCGYFLQVLTLAQCKPLPCHVIERHGSTWLEPDKFTCNGPYRMGAWLPEERLVFERRADYQGRLKGNLPRLEFLIMSQDEAIVAYDEDAIDGMIPDDRSWEEASRLIQLHPDDYQTYPSNGTLHLFFDCRKPPFDDARVRQAMALAIDRDRVVNRLSKGLELPAQGGIVPNGFPGHMPGIAVPHDPFQARQKLAETGYLGATDLPEFELLITSSHNRGNMFDEFCEQWLEYLGFEVRITEADFDTVLDRQDNDPAPLMVMGWTTDYPDPDSFLRVASWLRNSGWRHPEYEALVEGARRLTDREQRMAMYRQAERLLVRETPVIPIRYGLDHYLLKPWVVRWPVSSKTIILKDVIIEDH